MKLIVGLGNPGTRYRQTRHNVGFDVVDELARRHRLKFEAARSEAVVARVRNDGDRVLLAKPLTFMNRSGDAVAGLLHFYRVPLADVLIVIEDVNLPLGHLRARPGGSAGGHNGLRSVIEVLRTEAFSRLRIGVGRNQADGDLADYVLSRFEPEERSEIDGAVQRGADAVEMFVEAGIEPVMNTYNRRVTPDDEDVG